MLPDAQEWLVERLARAVEPARRRGAWWRSWAAAAGRGRRCSPPPLAVTAAEARRRVLLADLDPLGGGLDLVLGADDVPGLRWPDLARARGPAAAAGMLREALPRLDGLSVLAWGRGEPLDRAADGGRRGARRRRPRLRPRRRRPATSGDELPAAAGAGRPGAARGARHGLRGRGGRAPQLLAGLGRHGRRPCARWSRRRRRRGAARAELVADALGVPLLAELRTEPGLDAALSTAGEPPGLRRRGPLRRAAPSGASHARPGCEPAA